MSEPAAQPASSHDQNATLRPFVRVIVVEVIGSTPADAGAKMLVTDQGLHAGTVGGGRIEAHAIEAALAMLGNDAAPATQFVQWNLQQDIGMTCGGTMKLYFERCNVQSWPIVIFGAGHIAQSLVRLCLTLPCHITCVDSRHDWLNRLPRDAALRCVCMDEPSHFVEQLPAGAFVICMTRGHVTDRPILEAILRRDVPPTYLGVIGSNSKAAVLRRELLEQGISQEKLEQMICPIGLPIGTNHPGEIAVSIAAQLIEHRDRQTSSH